MSGLESLSEETNSDIRNTILKNFFIEIETGSKMWTEMPFLKYVKNFPS